MSHATIQFMRDVARNLHAEKQRSGRPARPVSQVLSPEVRLKQTLLTHARHYQVRVTRASFGGAEAAPQLGITLLTPAPGDSRKHQLFVGDDWFSADELDWDPARNRLSWHRGQGANLRAGHIELMPDHVQGFGNIHIGAAQYAVHIDLAPVTFTCAVSANAGQYLSGSAGNVKLNWDVTSAAWKQASWVESALQFSYGLQSQVFIGQKTYQVTTGFKDLQTGVSWTPVPDQDFSLIVTADLRCDFAVANATVQPPADDRSSQPGGVAHVLPYQLGFDFSGFGDSFCGALLTGDNSVVGTAVAVKGVANNPAIHGIYRLHDPQQTVASHVLHIHKGQLQVDGQAVPQARVQGNRLSWTRLPAALSEKTGLPESGELLFSQDGHQVVSGSGGVCGQRLTRPELALQPSALVASQPRLAAFAETTATATAPNPATLLNMSQFKKDAQGNWSDVVQAQSMQDFYAILQFYMDPSLRNDYIGGTPPVLDPTVRGVAAQNGADGTTPQSWYPTLGVAYLSSALSRVSDPGAPYLNAARAAKWMSQETAVSSVYKAQAPLLYSYRWTCQNPSTTQFLQDQISGNATYSTYIESDRQSWLAQMQTFMQDATPAQIAQMSKMINDCCDKGKQNLYWAYYLFRYATSPSALMLLQMMSLGQTTGVDGSEYSRRIQTTSALLDILDPSHFFAEQFVNAIQSFQIGNVLPQLIDYSGNLDDYTYATTAIIQQFLAQYGSSTDPKIMEAVKELNEIIAQGQVREVLDSFASLASTFAGIYSWEELAAKMESSWGSKISLLGAKLVVMASTAVGITAFVFGVMDWSKLSGAQKAQVVTGGVEVFVSAASAMIRRGIAYSKIYSTEATWGDRFKVIYGNDLFYQAGERSESGFAKWCVRDAVAAAKLAEEGAEQEMTLAVKIFGRNLDEFVATRLGAMFGIINIVLSAIAVANSTSTEERAGNGLLLASSCLEVLALVGQWALAAAGVEAIGGMAIATIASACTILAGFAAIVGVIILLIIAFRPQPTPIERFADGPAKDAGFYQTDKASIDELNIAGTGSQDTPQLVAIALELNGSNQQCLCFNNNNSVSIAPQALNLSTAFFLVSDAQAQCTISTLIHPDPQNPTAPTNVALTLNDNKQVQGLPPISDHTKQAQQLWVSEYVDGAQFDPQHPSQLASARFRFYNLYWFKNGGQKYYLSADGNTVTAGSTATAWTVALTTMYPSILQLSDIKLWNYQRNQQFMPYLGQPGSAPRTFSVSPTLPAFLTFDASSGQIAQKPGVAPDAMSSTAYTMTVRNAYGNVSANFNLSVQVWVPPPQARPMARPEPAFA